MVTKNRRAAVAKKSISTVTEKPKEVSINLIMIAVCIGETSVFF